jgi:chromosome segregation ATPase
MMGGIFGFLSSFGKEKFGKIGQTITQKIVAWDPETASQAEIEEMIKELDKITIEAGKSKTEYEREKAEADAAQKNYDKFLAAAELLHSRHQEAQASGNASQANQLEVSLNKLLGDLEELRPEVERELAEAEEAATYYEEVKSLAEITATKVKNARAMLDKAQRDMKRAEIEKQRSASRAEKAEKMAGLRSESSSLGVALAAMNKQAEDARAMAASSEMKAKLLSTERDSADEHIKAALDEVSGIQQTKNVSFSDRLASLKKK